MILENLQESLTEEDLKKTFNEYSEVQNAKIYFFGLQKFAFVSFKNTKEALRIKNTIKQF